MSAFLTGRQPRKTHGADIRVGISADQHVANAIGDQTRFPSLELGIETGRQRRQLRLRLQLRLLVEPLLARRVDAERQGDATRRLVFDRLFGGNDPKELAEARAKRDLYNKSVLDFVIEDAKGLSKTLGQGDQRKLDEYLTASARSSSGSRRPGEARPTASRCRSRTWPSRPASRRTSRTTSG